MRCCVENCFNHDSKKTNKSHGITFHKLPRDPDHSAAWLAALAELGYRMNKCLVVCSEHFLPEDFDDTRPNQRRVKSGAVPTIMAPVIQEELNVCRVCLALDVKMYNIIDFNLCEMFQNITGISATDKKGSLLQRVCWECAARLTAAAAFREKALLTDALLNNQVHITESDIALLKENYSSLKSPLSVKTAVTSHDIECEHTITENEIDNIFIPNDNTAIKDKKSEIRINEKNREFEECEPLIDVPVKTEVETDPIADNNMQFQHQKSVKFFDHFNNTSPSEDSEYEMRNTGAQFNNTDNILRDNKVAVLSDVNIAFVEDNDVIDKKPQLDVFGNIVNEASSEEEVSFKKYKQNMSSKVGIKKERTNVKITERLKEKIIALKQMRLSVPAIAQQTGASITSIYRLLRYYRNSDLNDYHYAEAGKEIAACSATVRLRMRQAGLDHILMKKPEMNVNMEQNVSKNKMLHDHLKQRIVALKQKGLSNYRVAYLLDTTRITVRKWWDRWCNEGHMNNYKSSGNKRKTTPQEDQLLIERVAQEETVHTPSLAKELGISVKCVRSRLREAGFKLQERKASVPLRSGRSHKVDEITKQQIIAMKHNGVSVTDIANQFRVTRTSVYLWWRQWCKENNIKIIKNTTTTAEQDKSLAELKEEIKEEKIVLTPSILSSKKSLWQKLPDVEFMS